jgi:hypothetical protein
VHIPRHHPKEPDMNLVSWPNLPEASTSEGELDDRPASAGGRGAEVDLALAVALVAMSAAVVLVLTGAWPA